MKYSLVRTSKSVYFGTQVKPHGIVVGEHERVFSREHRIKHMIYSLKRERSRVYTLGTRIKPNKKVSGEHERVLSREYRFEHMKHSLKSME